MNHLVDLESGTCDCHDFVEHRCAHAYAYVLTRICAHSYMCSLVYVCMDRCPCRHMCVSFYATKRFGDTDIKTIETIYQYWSRWVLATNYRDAYDGKAVLRPETYVGPFVGEDSDRILPPDQRKKSKGRPRKKRFVKRKKTTKEVRQIMVNSGHYLCNPHYGEHTVLF